MILETVLLGDETFHMVHRHHDVAGCFWVCHHVNDGAESVSCDMCGGGACDECVQGCGKCENVLCPTCMLKHKNGICDKY